MTTKKSTPSNPTYNIQDCHFTVGSVGPELADAMRALAEASAQHAKAIMAIAEMAHRGNSNDCAIKIGS